MSGATAATAPAAARDTEEPQALVAAPVVEPKSEEQRVTVEEPPDIPTRDDLPSRSRMPEVAPIHRDTPPSAALDAAITPKVPPELEAAPSSRPAASKPPPLLPSLQRHTVAATPASLAETARRAAPQPPPGPARAPRTASTLPSGARYARFVALALGAGLATVWISSRVRHGREQERPSVSVSSAQSVAVDAALGQVLAQAKTCNPGGTPAGVGELTVTIAPNGKVTSAELRGQSSDEGIRDCILSHVRSLEIPAFEGSAIEIRREIALGR